MIWPNSQSDTFLLWFPGFRNSLVEAWRCLGRKEMLCFRCPWQGHRLCQIKMEGGVLNYHGAFMTQWVSETPSPLEEKQTCSRSLLSKRVHGRAKGKIGSPNSKVG